MFSVYYGQWIEGGDFCLLLSRDGGILRIHVRLTTHQGVWRDENSDVAVFL